MTKKLGLVKTETLEEGQERRLKELEQMKATFVQEQRLRDIIGPLMQADPDMDTETAMRLAGLFPPK